MSDSQHSPVAIVTGAASGIGLEVSKMLLSKGYLVAMADWNETRGAEQVQELGPRTMFLKCNVADWNSHAAVFEATKKLWGRVDVYAANAGIADGYEPHVHGQRCVSSWYHVAHVESSGGVGTIS